MAERPAVADRVAAMARTRIRELEAQNDGLYVAILQAKKHQDTLEARLKAATERCGVVIWDDIYHDRCGENGAICPACQADLALLDGTTEPTQ